MGFTLDFEDFPLIVSETQVGAFTGRVCFKASGDIEMISIDGPFLKDPHLYLTPQDQAPDRRFLFRALSISIRKRMAREILDAIEDFHASAEADYRIGQWKESRI